MSQQQEPLRISSIEGRKSIPLILTLKALILFGILLRIYNSVFDVRFWTDEIFSIATAESPFVDIFLIVARFDVHPPLYYLQLHLWELLGTSDLWVSLNALLLGLLSLASVYWVVRKHFGEHTAWLALAIFAVLPQHVTVSETIRMYALCLILALWLWSYLEDTLSGPISARKSIGIIFLGLALTGSHGLGFFLTFFLFFQTGCRLMLSNRSLSGPRSISRFALLYFPVALAAGYPVAIGSIRSAFSLYTIDIPSLAHHLTLGVIGFGEPYWLGPVLLLVALLVAIANNRAIWMLGMLFILPLVVLLVLTIWRQSPLFFFRSVGLFLPFLVIPLAVGLDKISQRATSARWAIAVVLIAAFAVGSWKLFRSNEDHFELPTQTISELATPNAHVIGGAFEIHGVLRYLPSGPDLSYLTIQPPVKDGMRRLQMKLEGTILDRMGLFGDANNLQVGDLTLWPYQPNPEEMPSTHELWIIGFHGRECAYYGMEQTFVSADRPTVRRCEPLD